MLLMGGGIVVGAVIRGPFCGGTVVGAGGPLLRSCVRVLWHLVGNGMYTFALSLSTFLFIAPSKYFQPSYCTPVICSVMLRERLLYRRFSHSAQACCGSFTHQEA